MALGAINTIRVVNGRYLYATYGCGCVIFDLWQKSRYRYATNSYFWVYATHYKELNTPNIPLL